MKGLNLEGLDSRLHQVKFGLLEHFLCTAELKPKYTNSNFLLTFSVQKTDFNLINLKDLHISVFYCVSVYFYSSYV